MDDLKELKDLLTLSVEEQLEHDAQMLAFQFLGRIDEAMIEQKLSKKDLAKKVGTSPSFITQLFRGDRKPSWNILVKMGKALNLDFRVNTNSEIEELIENTILDYHKKWNKKRAYEKTTGVSESFESLMFVEKEDYALAG